MTSRPSLYRVISPTADSYGVPDTAAVRGKQESQLVCGEIFAVENINGDWAQGRAFHDGYAGYVERRHLRPLGDGPMATHMVIAAHCFIYSGDSIKTPVQQSLGFGSRLAIAEFGEKFSRLAGGGYIYTKHLGPIIENIDGTAALAYCVLKPLDLAVQLLDTPYYWGGRSGFGIDCSGLVQVTYAACGVHLPRDTEQQIAKGTPVDRTDMQPNDLVFFDGHVGIALDTDRLLHANAFDMRVTIEDLDAVAERAKGITGIRRFTFGG